MFALYPNFELLWRSESKDQILQQFNVIYHFKYLMLFTKLKLDLFSMFVNPNVLSLKINMNLN